MPRPLLLAALTAALLVLPGCVVAVGSPKTQNPTTGRQLLDLKSALDSGAITQEEYHAAKHKVLHGT